MKPRALCEFPAGLAAFSLYIHGGPKCRPPISRMGNKAGYAQTIAAALGLQGGQGAGCYVWAEADDDVRALLRAYPDAAMLTRIAEIIRGWADEEPRALWERLRAERKERGPRTTDDETAAWLVEGMWSYRQGDLTSGGPVLPGERRQDTSAAAAAAACKNLAEYATIQGMNRLICMADDGTGALMNTGEGGTRFGGEFATPPGEVAERFEGMAREVAGFTIEAQWAFRHGMPDSGFNPGVATGAAWNADAAQTAAQTAALSHGGWPPVAVLPRIPTADTLAAMLGTPGDLDGVVIYQDPPYAGTTGYRHDLGRDEVVAMARDFARLGAVVAISEQVAIPELVAEGWYAADITGGRKGQKRTFSAQKCEMLTMNREPAHRVAVQVGMWGAA